MIEDKIFKFNNGEISCEVELALHVMGGKWKPIILWHLGQNRVLRYGELRRGIKKITPKMLTEQLEELEEDGMIYRETMKRFLRKWNIH